MLVDRTLNQRLEKQTVNELLTGRIFFFGAMFNRAENRGCSRETQDEQHIREGQHFLNEN
jgi:hypothetical protein